MPAHPPALDGSKPRRGIMLLTFTTSLDLASQMELVTVEADYLPTDEFEWVVIETATGRRIRFDDLSRRQRDDILMQAREAYRDETTAMD